MTSSWGGGVDWWVVGEGGCGGNSHFEWKGDVRVDQMHQLQKKRLSTTRKRTNGTLNRTLVTSVTHRRTPVPR